MAICSLYYSIIKSHSYWNSNTQASIVDNGKRLGNNICLNGCISLSHLPKTVDVCGAELSFNVFSDNKEGLLCNSLHRKSIFENAMINNTECTGFLMWLSCYCINCIYNPQRRENICIPSWYTMKITYNQFSILGTQMVQLHSLRQLAVFIGNEGS